jgi:alpha-N-acetylglucosaminidase
MSARELLQRVLGPRADEFDVELVEGPDAFEVEASGGRVLLRGTNGVAIASALRHYLAKACGCHVTWDDPTPSLPERLPSLSAQVTSPWRYRYHFNFCTFGYSTAFWDWARWEREIDWMALHGVNLPLSVVGHEAIWLRVLAKFGLDDAAARAHIGSPAYFPWTWMGCVHDHGAPVTDAWIDAHVDLGHRILERQRSLGMTPVLPGFPGYVPAALAGDRGVDVDWMGFRNRALSPRDPLFHEFGLALLQEQEREFGSDGFYAIDPYIEGSPPDGDPAVIADLAGAIATTLTAHDPGNVWVLQGWPFGYRADFWDRDRIEAFLGAMPRDRTLVLDLWADHQPVWEKTAAFAGRPWLWCMLHSLGGRPGMHGGLDAVAAGIPAGPSGIGVTTESLDRDPVAYEMVADVAWHGAIPSTEDWFEEYARLRYGRRDERLTRAWRLLAPALYLRSDRPGPAMSIVMCRPRLDDALRPHQPVNLAAPFASPDAGLVEAWDLLVDSAIEHGASPGLARDLVDVGQEVLARLAKSAYDAVVAGAPAGATFIACLEEIDRLAATRADSTIGTWERQARAWGRTDAERAALQRDARRLLTCWVEPGHVLQDYAGRHWSGLVGGYYLPRWRIWLRALEEGMDVERFEAELRAFEEGWLASAPAPGLQQSHFPATSLRESGFAATADHVAVAAATRERHRRLAAAHNAYTPRTTEPR